MPLPPPEAGYPANATVSAPRRLGALATAEGRQALASRVEERLSSAGWGAAASDWWARASATLGVGGTGGGLRGVAPRPRVAAAPRSPPSHSSPTPPAPAPPAAGARALERLVARDRAAGVVARALGLKPAAAHPPAACTDCRPPPTSRRVRRGAPPPPAPAAAAVAAAVDGAAAAAAVDGAGAHAGACAGAVTPASLPAPVGSPSPPPAEEPCDGSEYGEGNGLTQPRRTSRVIGGAARAAAAAAAAPAHQQGAAGVGAEVVAAAREQSVTTLCVADS